MKVGVIGAGFTGLALAYKLVKEGYEVEIFESEEKPGGLAIGFKERDWEWSLEKHYHHLFTSDLDILNLAKDVEHPVNFYKAKTATFYKGNVYQLDSPINLLKFKPISFIERLRTGLVLLYLKLIPFWKPLERVSAQRMIIDSMGKESWEVLWKPLMVKKFGKYADKISASWFWARIKKRSAKLGYPEGGFEALAQTIEKSIKEKGGMFIYKSSVLEIRRDKDKVVVRTNKDKEYLFDKIICTLPTSLFVKITPQITSDYKERFGLLKGLGAINLVIAIKDKFFKDDTYWLNVNDLDYPFLAIVEQTNLVPQKRYGGQYIIYVGNYLESNHKYFSYSDEELLDEYLPFLKKVNPNFNKESINNLYIFKAAFAQPIVTKNFSDNIPPFKTPIEGIFLANIQQVYPWDRGTNYAVEIGNRVADLIMKESEK